VDLENMMISPKKTKKEALIGMDPMKNKWCRKWEQ
jgi:hypothetical protein